MKDIETRILSTPEEIAEEILAQEKEGRGLRKDGLIDPRLGVLSEPKRSRAMGQSVLGHDQEIIIEVLDANDGLPSMTPPVREMPVTNGAGLDTHANGQVAPVDTGANRHPGGRAMGR